MITRLDHQKGVDLVPEALQRVRNKTGVANHKWQFVLLGTGDPKLEAEVQRIASEFQGQVSVAIRYSEALSHRIFSGADMLLIPSRYEPCGLTQMIAMRYGCIPIGKATGGLKDTIQDYFLTQDSTGFLFSDAKPESLADAIITALRIYEDQDTWKGLQQRSMKRDFSWANSARKYLSLYLDLHSARAG